MATGDTADFIGRIKAVLPSPWFPDSSLGEDAQVIDLGPIIANGSFLTDSNGDDIDASVFAPAIASVNNTPILDTLLTGFAWALAWAYSLIALAGDAVLIGTSPDIWLDLHAQDYFGLNGFPRKTNEPDTSYAPRLESAIFPAANTRAALIAAVEGVTGIAPTVFEPDRPDDTGGWGVAAGYNVGGGYGSLELPFQAFLTVKLPVTGGVANVGGYYNSASIYAPGGYGVGALEYVTLDDAGTQITEAEVYAAIERVKPAGSIIWTRFSN